MSEGAPTLADKLRFLSSPSAYPDQLGPVESLETHMSWVFLTSDRVYKLKKPVRFEYLDFSTLPAREVMCRTEVRLNRRLATDVYLGVAPVVLSNNGLKLGGEGKVVDWVVVMRRLDARQMLDRLIRDTRVTDHQLERLASVLANFYAHARRKVIPFSAWLDRWRRSVHVNDRLLSNARYGLAHHETITVNRALRLFIERRARLVADRVRQGRIVEGHGDLRPEHIWLGDSIKILDCLEFNADLRTIDPLQELAYLDLECRRLGRTTGAGRLISSVCRRLKDDAPKELFLFYRCYAAALRARLTAAHVLEPAPRLPEKWLPLARRYLTFALADAKQLNRLITAPEGRRSRPLGGGGVSHRRAEAPR